MKTCLVSLAFTTVFLALSNKILGQCPPDLVVTPLTYSCNSATQTYTALFTVQSTAPAPDWYSIDMTADVGTLTPSCQSMEAANAGSPACYFDYPQGNWNWVCGCDGQTYLQNGYADFATCVGVAVVSNQPCDGTYPVRYTITNVPWGQDVTLSAGVRTAISLPDVFGPTCGYTLTLSAPTNPVAAFSSSTTGLVATFNNTSSNSISYLWDFGDGQTSSQASPSHTYAAAGTYQVCLTTTGVCGTAQRCESVVVGGGNVGQDTVPPCIEWQKTLGGDFRDELTTLQQTSDGGYILGGHSLSHISGEKTEDRQGAEDYWVIKLDGVGNIQWQNTIGGSGIDYLHSLQQTSDGGYILGGWSNSDIGGDKTENSLGGRDYWVIKLNSDGNIQWQNTIGGSSLEELYSIRQTSDGGYILGGWSNSDIGGDKTENSLSWDYWVVKLDETGNIQWQNTIGGDSNEPLLAIQQTSDNGYILGGMSASNISGDKTESGKGGEDYWVVKLDATGSIQWQNTIGGNDYDWLSSIQQTTDGGYILGGTSESNISGDKSENSLGGRDYWILKLDTIGNIQWQNTIGGNRDDQLNYLRQAADSGYIVGGTSGSDISGDKTEGLNGDWDFWLIKLDAFGNIQWQKTLGGVGLEVPNSIQQTSDGNYIVGGRSDSNIGGNKSENSRGYDDYWVIKLAPCPPPCSPIVTTTADTGPGSLREAIECANSNPGPDTIRFQIPGAGPHVISPSTSFAQIMDDSLTIDATTQPGWSPGHIVLDGTGMSSTQLAILVANSAGFSGFEMYGLTLRNFPGTALGLYQCRNVKIGTPGKGNVFYGNATGLAQNRVQIVLQEVETGTFQGNTVGIREDFSIPNVMADIAGLGGEMRDFNIGGDRGTGEGNVFGHCFYAINLWENPNSFDCDNIQIFGNDIGIAPSGADIGNAEHGISIGIPTSNANIFIGDGTAAHRNRIAHNGAGVFITNAASADVSRNEFSCNAIGINNSADEPKAPKITSANAQKIIGTAPFGSRVEVFSQATCLGTGCQGTNYLGTATADNAGNWSLAGSFASGDRLTATATLNQRTSEFAACKTVCGNLGASASGIGLNCYTPTVMLNGDAAISGCTFSWAGPNGFVSNEQNPYVGQSGDYFLTVTDPASGCMDTASVSITADFNIPIAQAEGDTLTCLITAVNLVGSASLPVVFAWSGPNGFISNEQNPSVSTPGDYALTVTATNGCTATAITSVVLDGNFPDAMISGPPTACFGASASLSGNSTTSGVTFAWTGPGGFVSSLQNPPAVSLSGVYVLTVTGSNGCATMTSHFLEFLPKLESQLATTICLGQSITVGSQVFDQTNPTGQVVLQAANGCDSTVNVSLNFWPPINLTATQQAPVSGPGASDGQANVDISGGSPPFSLAWTGPSPGQLSNQVPGATLIPNLQPGNYTLTVADANGCTATANFTISDCAVSATLAPQNASCFGLFDGGLMLNLTGGAAPFLVKWSGTSSGQLPLQGAGGPIEIPNLPAGTYTVTVTDAGGTGCSAMFSSNIGQPSALALSGFLEDCLPDSTAYIVQFSVGGGTPDYSLASGAGNLAGTQFTSAPVPSGQSYLFEIADANGCTATRSGVKSCDCSPVPVASAFALAPAVCTGGSISLGENGVGGTAWNWSGPGGWLATQRNPVRSFVAEADGGIYTVIVTGPTGCMATSTVSVEVRPNAETALSAQVCQDERYVFGTDTLTATSVGTFSFDQKFTAANGCDSLVTLALTVVENQPVAAEPDPAGPKLAPGETELPLPVLANDALPADGKWSLDVLVQPASGAADDDANGLLFSLTKTGFSGTDSLLYLLCSQTCPTNCDSAWAWFFVQNDDSDVLKDAITNVLTPGLQDGKNDLFDPVENLREKGFSVDENTASLTIFNRWGEVVHFAGKPPLTWDGKVGGQPVPQATYYFVLNTGVGEPFKGSVTVLQ